MADGLIEIKPDGCIDFNGDMFDLVYAKVWVRTRSDLLPPDVMLGLPSFRHLLGQRIDRLVVNLIPDSMKILETCCYGTNPRNMREAYESLVQADRPTRFPPMCEFVYCAAADAGLPEYLTITTITCEYGNTSAVRWVFNRTASTYELSEDQRFAAVAQRLASLGGALRAERLEIGPCDWSDLLAWADSAPADDREHIAIHLSDRAYDAYGQSNRSRALDYLNAASRLAPSWRAANNQAYILLTASEFDSAIEWAGKAVDLAVAPEDRALSRYNRAIALFGGKRYSAAREEIVAAESDLAASDNRDISFGYLLVAELTDGKIGLSEARNAKLTAACGTLLDLLDMMNRFPSISPGDDPMV